MVTLTNRLPASSPVTSGGVNASIGEIQAALNRISIVRGTIPDPQSDYFMFDNETGTLYLMTIEGEQKQVNLV